MLLGVSLALGIGLGYMVGGRASALTRTRIRGEWLLLGALVVQALAPTLRSLGGLAAVPGYWLWLASFPVLAGVALRNANQPGLLAVASGGILNFAAITSNGYMPVSLWGADMVGHVDEHAAALLDSATHGPLSEMTRLTVLSDVMPVPGPAVLRGVVSVGDVLLVAGVVAFLVASMSRTTFDHTP